MLLLSNAYLIQGIEKQEIFIISFRERRNIFKTLMENHQVRNVISSTVGIWAK